MRFKTDWASLIVERKFTIFALSYFVFEGNFSRTSPRGLYLEGRFNGGFFAFVTVLEGLIFKILRCPATPRFHDFFPRVRHL